MPLAKPPIRILRIPPHQAPPGTTGLRFRRDRSATIGPDEKTTADVTISLADLSVQSGRIESIQCGEAISAGAPIAISATVAIECQANIPDRNSCYGLALMNGAEDDYIAILRARSTSQRVTIAASGIVEGTVYCVSRIQGGICPRSDLLAGDTVILLGVGRDDGKSMDLRIQNTDTVL